MKKNMKRKVKGIIFFSICIITTIIAISLLIIILNAIFVRGLPAINLKFLTTQSKNFGKNGGIFYQAMGTIILISTAGFLAVPIAIGSAIYQSEYLSLSRKLTANLFIHALNAVPTIIFGLFGYMFFGVFLKLGVSWLTGSFILSIMILPTLIVSISEAIDSIPIKYREAGLSLGLSQERLIRAVIIPQSLHGVISGLLLGLARAAGETAAIMFTATTFSGVLLPSSFHEPVTALQTHILILAQEALSPKTLTNVWGTALVLVALVMLMSIASMLVRGRLTQEAKR